MASQVNHNAAYIYSVEGLTVWERLRVIRNFLEDRRLALALGEVGLLEAQYKLSIIKDEIEFDFENTKYKIMLPQQMDALNKCKSEVKFLETLEKELIALAEPLRVAGKTDDEMYEINYYNELVAINVREAHADMVAYGRLAQDTVKRLLKCPPALDALATQGLINKNEILALVSHESTNNLNLLPLSAS